MQQINILAAIYLKMMIQNEREREDNNKIKNSNIYMIENNGKGWRKEGKQGFDNLGLRPAKYNQDMV